MSQQYPFIDMHTHFFNGRYLPLDGILRSWKIPTLLARALTRVIVPLVSKSAFSSPPASEADDDDLEAILQQDDATLFKGIVKRTVRAIEKHADKQLDDPAAQMDLAQMMEGLRELHAMQHHTDSAEIYSKNFAERLAGSTKAATDILETAEAEAISDTLYWALSEVDRERDPRMELGHNHADDDDGHDHGHGNPDSMAHADKALRIGNFGSLGQIIRFVASMFLSERNRYRLLVRDYGKGKPPGGYDATHFLGLPPDMQMPYQFLYGRRTIPPSYEAKLQTSRMVALSRDTDGHMLTFGAVDPFRVFDWEEYVDHAVALGVTGFKIYPPMGFRAANKPGYTTPVNPAADPAYAKTPPNSPRMNATVRDILTRMNADGLRLFTHCTPEGFESQKGNGVHSDPAFWDHAITEYGLDDLWLFLGHGGGATDVDWNGWLCEEDHWTDTFAYRAVKMCQTHRNVYLGVGYITSLLRGEGRDTMMPRLKKLLMEDSQTPFQLRDKICFGSDWSMPQMIGKTREYLDIFYAFFDDPDIAQYAPAFFEGNARRYLGLNQIS